MEFINETTKQYNNESSSNQEPVLWFIEVDNPTYKFHFTLNIIQMICTVLIVLCNTIVLLLFYQERRSLMDRLSNLHIISMAFGDIVQGLVNWPAVIYMSFGMTLAHPWCFELALVISTTSVMQIYVILAVTIDRYWAIVYPLHYKRNMTLRKAICKLQFFI